MAREIKEKKNIAAVALDMDGNVIFRGKSSKAVEAKIAAGERQFSKRPGRGGAYLPRSIVTLTDGKAIVERKGQSSTTWGIAE